MTNHIGRPPAQGLYDPANEHDNCGVGFIANIKGRKSHSIVKRGIEILCNLTHRGAVSIAQKYRLSLSATYRLVVPGKHR